MPQSDPRPFRAKVRAVTLAMLLGLALLHAFGMQSEPQVFSAAFMWA